MPGNKARAAQWQNSGEYRRLSGCPECGGWYLNRKDEMAGISAHFAGCSRAALSLFEHLMGWSKILDYYDRLKLENLV